MTKEKEDLETIVCVYTENNESKAWDLNGFEIEAIDDVLSKHKKTPLVLISTGIPSGAPHHLTQMFSDDQDTYHVIQGEKFSDIFLKDFLKAFKVKYSQEGCRYEVYVSRNGNEHFAKPIEFSCFGKPHISPVKIDKTLGIIPLGIGSGFSTEHDNTCFILDADKLYLIDCPEDLKKLGYLEEKINDIILTHNDPDHVGALRKLIQKKCFKYKTKLNLYTTLEIYDDFMESLHNLQKDLQNSINFVELKTSKDYENNGLKIKIRDNFHGELPTIGLKFCYNKRTLGYSSDCHYTKNKLEAKDIETVLDKLNATEWDENISERLLSFVNTAYHDRSRLDALERHLVAIKNGEKFNVGIKPGAYFMALNKDHIRNLAKAVVKRYETNSPLWFSDCDMIIHEATDNPNDPVHTYIGELEKLPDDIKSRMYLVHIPDGFNLKHMTKDAEHKNSLLDKIKEHLTLDAANDLIKNINQLSIMNCDVKYLVFKS
jgi:ribonuclease BN (tRNA processing enzyme)